jgi:hypothetical protein
MGCMNGTKLARLYKRTTPSGKVYLEGRMTGVSRLIIIPNDRKDDARDPDFYAYVVPNRGARQLDDDELTIDEAD